MDVLFLILFVVSFLANIFLVYWLRHVLKDLGFHSSQMFFLKDSMAGFMSHMGSLKETTVLYGDDRLLSIYGHGLELYRDIEEFKRIYWTTEAEIDEDENLMRNEDFVEKETVPEIIGTYKMTE